MFKRFFHSSIDDDTPTTEIQTAKLALAVAESANAPTGPVTTSRETATFEKIYQTASAKPQRMDYDILKVADMLTSPHLAGMSSETKRASLLMALEAARANIEDLLQDAVARQRALNDYEEAQQAWLKTFEATKLQENRQIQAEMDRLTSQYMTRIQENLDEVARAQDDLRGWQKQKQQEAQRITEAATYCVPQGTAPSNGTLTAVLERAASVRR